VYFTDGIGLVYCLVKGRGAMKKFAPVLLLIPACLWAAEFWEAKPFTEWSDKDVQKLMTNSPWAKSIGVPMSGPSVSTPGGNAGGNGDDGTTPSAPISDKGGGGGGRGGRGGGAAPGGGAGLASSADVILRWYTAAPIKQATVKMKFKGEAATSTDAKAFLDRQETAYVFQVTGAPLRSVIRGTPDQIKQAVMDKTSLSVKGKPQMKPSEIQLVQEGRAIEFYFIFPKSAGALSMDDKEAEFSTKIGDIGVKNKFQFNKMTVNGKLEL
jgi:hypothetical protein